MSERDGDDDIDDASLKSMRAVWLSMRDEEPPATGMSALLAAARDQAEQMRDKPSLWQRMLAQLRRPPALAFATVMLLVGGAVLVTRTADQQVESMTADTPSMHTRDVDVQMNAPAADPVEEPSPVGTEKLEPAPAPPAVKDVSQPPKKQKPKSRAAADVDVVGKNEPDRHHPFEDEAPTPGFAEGKGTDTTVMESPGRAGGKAAQKAAPPSPPPTEPAPLKQEAVTLSADSSGSTPPDEQLARQAESAASRGDCAAVRVIVARMKKQDERFYKTRLGKNAAVTKCL